MLGARPCSCWSDLAKIARELLPPGDQIRRNLENAGITRSCEDLLSLFDPIANALNLMQRRCTTLAEGIEIWVELLERIPKKVGGYNVVVERSKQALECPFFLLANVLDPRFAGANLSAQQIDKARQFAEEEGSPVALALNLYLSRSPPFRPKMFDQRADTIAWWQAGQVSGFPTQLCALALRLCGCSASSATLERNFSTMGHVYGRRRTNLGVEKAGKLTFLFRSLNAIEEADQSSNDDSD